MALDLELDSLKQAVAEAEALSTAVGLQPTNAGSLNSGGAVDLDINPRAEASATSADPDQGAIATAQSYGLGLGTSGFYFDDPGANPYYQASGFNSPNLTGLIGASGSIDGVSRASARTTSAADAATEAVAINIGLADLNLEAPDASVLRIGTAADPFEAIALAASTSLATDDCGCEEGDPLSQLEATAIARGIENPLDGSRTILGQPVANVAATAHIAPLTTNSAIRGGANADAIALQGVDLVTTPTANGDGRATIIGNATATTGLQGLVPEALSQANGEETALHFRGQAIGIDAGTAANPGQITGNSDADNVIQGSGVVTLDLPDDAYLVNSHLIDEPCVDTNLKAIGLQHVSVTTGLGDDRVIGTAGIDTGVAVLQANNSTVDLAAIRNADIRTGLGDDQVVGQITSLPTPDVFDSSTNPLAFNGFEGGQAGANVSQNLTDNAANSVRTGIGDDWIAGSARDYLFEGGIGDDNINLDHAWNALLVGGLGKDRLVADGTTQNVTLVGESGDDELIGGSGDGATFDGADRIDGGSGIDVSTGNGGRDTFVYSHGIGAWQGTSDGSVNELLQDEASWNQLSSEQQALVLGRTERVLDFTTGTESNGDVLELSAAMGTITAEQWANEGVLMTAAQASDRLHAGRIGVVVDSLSNIQAMGLTNRHYAISVSNDGSEGMLLYDADGDFSQGSQVVAHLNGSLNAFHKSNISFV
jgi:hypothetical protein